TDGLPRAVSAGRDVGLDRADVAPAVEDHRDLLADRQAAHAERDGGRCVGVAHACSSDGSAYIMTLLPAGFHRQPGEDRRARLDTVKLLYKPVGIVLG